MEQLIGIPYNCQIYNCTVRTLRFLFSTKLFLQDENDIGQFPDKFQVRRFHHSLCSTFGVRQSKVENEQEWWMLEWFLVCSLNKQSTSASELGWHFSKAGLGLQRALHSRMWPTYGSVAQWCPTYCDPIDCITTGFPVLHHLLEFAQTHFHWVGDAIQPSYPLLAPSPPALNLSQH